MNWLGMLLLCCQVGKEIKRADFAKRLEDGAVGLIDDHLSRSVDGAPVPCRGHLPSWRVADCLEANWNCCHQESQGASDTPGTFMSDRGNQVAALDDHCPAYSSELQYASTCLMWTAVTCLSDCPMVSQVTYHRSLGVPYWRKIDPS